MWSDAVGHEWVSCMLSAPALNKRIYACVASHGRESDSRPESWMMEEVTKEHEAERRTRGILAMDTVVER